MPGCLIAFEGTEGSGKSSQIRRARIWLEGQVDLVVTREPGGTPTAEAIRSLVLSQPFDARDAGSDAFLMNAARYDHCRRVIAPAISRGAVVLTDRFSASTLAYQGAGDGVPEPWLTSLQSLATGGLASDRTLLFDLQVEVGLSRRRGAGELNAMDERDLAFHRRVGAGYRSLSEASPDTWTVIDADRDESSVWADVRSAIGQAMRQCDMDAPS